MKCNELVSIIVPIYNSKEYLNECIQSIRNQTYGKIEVILVDDGSNDGSTEICLQYAKIDGRIKFIHNTNHGVSYSRNCGLKVASGNYILFIDSDDTINKDYIKAIMEESGDYEIILSKVADINKEKETEKERPLGEHVNETCLISKDLKSLFIYFYNVWGKLYKKEIIIRNEILFDENVSIGEDILFNLRYLKHIETYHLAKQAIYFYHVKSGDSLGKHKYLFNKESLLNHLLSEMKDFIRNSDTNEKNTLFWDFCFVVLDYVGDGYFRYRRRCQIIHRVLDKNMRASNIKREIALAAFRLHQYWILYLYFKIKSDDLKFL